MWSLCISFLTMVDDVTHWAFWSVSGHKIQVPIVASRIWIMSPQNVMSSLLINAINDRCV
jgi:hypothetical protein